MKVKFRAFLRPRSKGLLCSVCFSLCAFPAQGAPEAPPGAFLRRPASSVLALSRQARTDRLVGIRYARLFHMPLALVPEALAALHVTKLRADRVMEVHYVYPGERIGYKLRRVRKGTSLYALPDGTPALIQICGNPIRGVNPITTTHFQPRSVLPSEVPDFNPEEQIAAATPMPGLDSLRSGTPDTELDFVEIPDIVPATNLPPVPPQRVLLYQPPVTHIAHWANGGLWLLPLAGLPFLFGSGGGGSAGPPGGTTPPPVTPPVTPPPVTPPPVITGGATPEPGTLALFASIAISSLLVAKRRRQRLS